MANLIDSARRQWQDIGNQTQPASITPAMMNEAGQTTLNAVEYGMPYVGANGNWWVGGADTGERAAGAQGAPGPKGDKGDTGAPGQKGDKGDKGDGVIYYTTNSYVFFDLLFRLGSGNSEVYNQFIAYALTMSGWRDLAGQFAERQFTIYFNSIPTRIESGIQGIDRYTDLNEFIKEYHHDTADHIDQICYAMATVIIRPSTRDIYGDMNNVIRSMIIDVELRIPYMSERFEEWIFEQKPQTVRLHYEFSLDETTSVETLLLRDVSFVDYQII